MKKLFLIFLVTLLSSSLLVHAEKLAEFQEYFRAVYLAMDENRVYIADKANSIIHIYSRKDFTHIRQFGRKGQGPTDFEFIGFIRVYPDYLFISAGRKVSYYSKNGDFLKTVTPSFPTTGGYIPLDSNFICKNYLGENPKEKLHKIIVELLDSKFKKKKDLYLAELDKFVRYNFETGKTDVLVTRDCFKLEVYNDRLYVGNTDVGFFFIVFDTKGNRLYEINLSYENRKITSKEKKKIMDEFREAIGEQEFNRRKASHDYIFPKFYPAYYDFTVADGKIYVFSYPIIDVPQEVIILDLRGNFLGKTIIPKIGPLRPSYCINKGKLYYMNYNNENYKWELHVAKLD